MHGLDMDDGVEKVLPAGGVWKFREKGHGTPPLNRKAAGICLCLTPARGWESVEVANSRGSPTIVSAAKQPITSTLTL